MSTCERTSSEQNSGPSCCQTAWCGTKKLLWLRNSSTKCWMLRFKLMRPGNMSSLCWKQHQIPQNSRPDSRACVPDGRIHQESGSSHVQQRPHVSKIQGPKKTLYDNLLYLYLWQDTLSAGVWTNPSRGFTICSPKHPSARYAFMQWFNPTWRLEISRRPAAGPNVVMWSQWLWKLAQAEDWLKRMVALHLIPGRCDDTCLLWEKIGYSMVQYISCCNLQAAVQWDDSAPLQEGKRWEGALLDLSGAVFLWLAICWI